MSGPPAGRADSVPGAIRLRVASRLLEVDWQDGATSAWTHRVLRQHCRCAACEAARRAGTLGEAAVDVTVMEVEPWGPGALRFTFNDGHRRGIYPYAYLRQLPDSTHKTTGPQWTIMI